MPSTIRLSPPANTLITEPVAISLLRSWVRVDGNEEDDVLLHCLKAAREKVENYTGLFFAGSQRLQITFDLSEAYELPAGVTIVSVSGFFKTLAELEAWNLEEYRKGISVNRQAIGWQEALNEHYMVVVDLPANPDCPEVAKAAILELAAEWYRNRETSSSAGVVPRELPVSWKVKLAELRSNPLL